MLLHFKIKVIKILDVVSSVSRISFKFRKVWFSFRNMQKETKSKNLKTLSTSFCLSLDVSAFGITFASPRCKTLKLSPQNGISTIGYLWSLYLNRINSHYPSFSVSVICFNSFLLPGIHLHIVLYSKIGSQMYFPRPSVLKNIWFWYLDNKFWGHTILTVGLCRHFLMGSLEPNVTWRSWKSAWFFFNMIVYLLFASMTNNNF